MADEGLKVPARPCPTCPYRKDVPSAVWNEDEYRKLPKYDDGGEQPLEIFHCHQENSTGIPTVCVGWVGCHGYDAIGVRLAVSLGAISHDDVAKCEATDVPLYETGKEACEAGLEDIEEPSFEARQIVDKLVRKGTGR